MPNDHGVQETARLMKDIGIAVNMSYGCWLSGAYNTAVIPGFNYFGYNSVKSKNISGFLTNQTLNQQLYLNRPVLMAGSKGQVGHAWVCDQYYYYRVWDNSADGDNYSLTMYHMNWGWNGQNNGFYSLNFLNPTGTNFNDDLEIFYDFNH